MRLNWGSGIEYKISLFPKFSKVPSCNYMAFIMGKKCIAILRKGMVVLENHTLDYMASAVQDIPESVF